MSKRPATGWGKSRGRRSALVVGAVVFLFVIFVYTGWTIKVRNWRDANGAFSAAGTFGDAFGTINALFSGLALAAVAATLWLTQQQIELQREDMLDQRELAAAQNQFVFAQAVQEQFFQMLGSWQEVAHEIAYDNQQGRAALARIADRLLRTLQIEVVAKSL